MNALYAQSDTIFAWATAPGQAGVAICRISGPDTLSIYHQLTGTSSRPTPRTAHLAHLKDPVSHTFIDEALCLYFQSPNSFTGEDIIELHCHGSRAIMHAINHTLHNIDNVRMADAGEFSRRAFLHHKMDLTQAEGLMDLIHAETSAQHRQALRQMQGSLGKFYSTLRADIIHMLAHMEAYIDFPDEDIPAHVLEDIEIQLNTIIKKIVAQLQQARCGEKIRDGVSITIAGPPNAGKSSLINLLAGRDVAITHDTVGTTRDIIEVQMNIAGYAVTLADTAGIRNDACDAVEKKGIIQAQQRAKEADITILVFDINRLEEGGAVIDSNDYRHPIVVINKTDTQISHPLPHSFGQSDAFFISVKEETGIDSLLATVEKMIINICTAHEAPMITQARHRYALEEALIHCQQAIDQETLELRCEELRNAANAIAKITGHIAVDDILDIVFSSFCIGK